MSCIAFYFVISQPESELLVFSSFRVMPVTYAGTVSLWPITELVATNQHALLRHSWYGNGIFCAGCGLERNVSYQDVIYSIVSF